jgi:DNA topoisomerase-1
MPKAVALTTDPAQSARIAGLRYVSDRMPGIRRVGSGKTFRYFDANSRLIRDVETLNRIRALAVPPAWKNVWICPNESGHLQAVGYDARGRKQYRYHALWRKVRDETKFYRMAAFGKALPKIRRRVAADLKASGLPRHQVLATIVRLLETTFIRIGNEEYTRQNHSFGLTTLRSHHVKVSGPNLRFYFRGKSGVKHAISLEDRHLAKIVRRLRDLPGYELFQYYDDEGEIRSVASTDVNDYLREISGEDFTAKDFRTWAGTVLAVQALCRTTFTTAAQAKRNIKKAIETVAERLGNTVAVCRKSYIHPAVLDAYADRSLLTISAEKLKRRRRDEAAVVQILKKTQKPKPAPSLTETLERSLRQIQH